MKQAFHIFLKDVRRLWLQIAALMLALAYFALVDVGWSAATNYNTGSQFMEFIVGISIWFLITRAVHEESLPGENQFWLTRPYDRNSLLASKIMMAVFVVVVPLLIADCAILAAQSLPVAENFGGLILRQVITACWLILPPFAIASITRTLAEDILIGLVVVAIAVVGYFPGTTVPDFRAMNEKYPLIIAIVLLVAATWRQYSSRGTNGSRAIVALAVLLPALPFPTPVALALAGVRNNPATDAISLVPAAEHVEEKERSDLQRNNLHCAPVPVSIPGMQPGWRLSVLSQKDTFESPAGKTASMGWWSSSPDGGRVSDISVCLTSQGLRELGIVVPLTVHTSIALAVYAADPPVLATITLQPFSVPGVGICQFQQYFGSRYYVLSCKAPVSVPKPGRVTLVSDDTWNWPISNIHYVWAPMNLISDLSPVDKWVAMAADRQIREGLADRGQLEFQPETRIAVLRREITVKEVLLDPNN